MARPRSLRYTVDGSDKSYADFGPALSLSVTLAARAMTEGVEKAFYVRDSIGGEVLGYSESLLVEGCSVVTTCDNRKKGRA